MSGLNYCGFILLISDYCALSINSGISHFLVALIFVVLFLLFLVLVFMIQQCFGLCGFGIYPSFL